jgi:hypothetical protein
MIYISCQAKSLDKENCTNAIGFAQHILSSHYIHQFICKSDPGTAYFPSNNRQTKSLMNRM